MQPYSSPITRVWISFCTVSPLWWWGKRTLPPPWFARGLVRLGVLVDQRAGDLLVFELVAAALDLGQVDRLVGPVVAGTPAQVRAEAAVEVRERVEVVLETLAGDLQPERLEGVAEDGGPHEAGLRPGGVVDLRVVLLD